MSVHKIVELREERAALVDQARRIVDDAEAEGRNLTDGEQTEWDARMESINELEGRISRMEQLDAMGSLEERVVTPEAEVATLDTGSDEYRMAWARYIASGDQTELRALQVGTDSEGGYITPNELLPELIDVVNDYNVMRQLGTVVTNPYDFKLPKVSSQGDAALVAEEGARNETDDAFTQVQFSAYKANRMQKISEELEEDSIINLSSYIFGSFAQAVAELEEEWFVAGTGSSQPQGVTAGAGTGTTLASATAVTMDELIALQHDVIAPYRAKGAYLFKDSTVEAIRKLKDSNNQYLWQPSTQAGQPDVLLGKPCYTSPSMPALGASNVAGVFGDFKRGFVISQRFAGVKFMRLNELYRGNGQIGFDVYSRVDSNVVDSNAIVKMTCAAS